MNKSKAANYVHRYQRMNGDVDVIYRFLDTVEDCLKPQEKKLPLALSTAHIDKEEQLVSFFMR